MNNTKSQGLWPNVILFSITAALLAIFAFGFYKSYNCSQVCISSLSQGGGYTISLRLAYANSPIPDSKVAVLINNAYQDVVSTNTKSYLTFRAPLKIGLNTIKVEYDGNYSSAAFIYTGGMLYMLLIPIGALIFISARKFALSLSDRNKVTFYTDGRIPGQASESLLAAFESSRQKGKRIIHGLPELVSDVSSELVKIENKPSGKDPLYLCQKINIRGKLSASFNCVADFRFTEEAAAAREFYEHSMKSGMQSSLQMRSCKTLVKKNKIIVSSSLSVGRLSDLAKNNGKIRLFLFSVNDAINLSKATRSFSNLGAALLILQTTAFIEIIRYD